MDGGTQGYFRASPCVSQGGEPVPPLAQFRSEERMHHELEKQRARSPLLALICGDGPVDDAES